MEDSLYRIGELAKMYKISIKTLRYYEECGLFVPGYISPESGYRYYRRDQFERLRLIKFLKSLGLSLHEIKDQINSMNAKQYTETLHKQCEILEEKIQREISLKCYIEQRIREIENAEKAEKNKVIIEYIPEQRVIFFPWKICCREDFERAVLEFRTKYNVDMRMGRIGQVLSMENLQKGIYDVFCGIELWSDGNSNYKGEILTIPAGQYATIYYNRLTGDSEPFWRMLLEDIRKSSFEVRGNAVRATILEKGIGIAGDDYLACIRIPVGPSELS